MDKKENNPLAALLRKPAQSFTDAPVKAQPKQKPESQKTPIEKDVTSIKKDVIEVKKNTKVLADLAKKADKETKRSKPTSPVIPTKGQGFTGDVNADTLKVLASIDKKLSSEAAQTKKGKGEEDKKGPGPLASLVDTLGDIVGGRGRPRGPKPAPGPVGQTLSTVGEVVAQAGRAALPLAAPAAIAAAPFVATRQQIEKIKKDPNAPGLEFNPLAQTLRGEEKTVGQAGRRNRDRAVGQIFSNTIQAAIDSDMTDDELYNQYGRNREQLKEWVAKSKPGQTYDINTSAPAVANREAEKLIGVETPQLPAEVEGGTPPPITGMESAFVPTPPAPKIETPKPPGFFEKIRRNYNTDANDTAGDIELKKRMQQIEFDRMEEGTALEKNSPEYEKLEEEMREKIKLENPEAFATTENNTLRVNSFVTTAAGSGGPSQSQGTGITAGKSLFGSEFLGGLITKKGLTKESSVAMSMSESGGQTQASSLMAERRSGGIFGRDTYVVYLDGKEVPVDKYYYNQIKALMDEGKAEDAAALVKHISEQGDYEPIALKSPEEVVTSDTHKLLSDIKSIESLPIAQTIPVLQNVESSSTGVTPALTPQVTPQPTELDTGPVSGTERAIMKIEGLDPDDEFDRKLYRRRTATQRGAAAVTPPANRGADIGRVSTENNDLRDQANAGGSAPPMIINNNNSTATQTNVPVPAQPRVDSSFSKYGQSRASYW